MADAIPLEQLLRSLGFSTVPARAAARAAIEQAGLTNARKTRIHPNKAGKVRARLAESLVRTCGAGQCIAAVRHDPRRRVEVDPGDCEVCEGRPTQRALRSLERRLREAGVGRVLVVGGSPDKHAELRGFFAESPVKLELVEGTRVPQAARAQASLERADIVVIWATTILAHKVSAFFMTPQHAHKTLTVARRGIGSLTAAIEHHLQVRSGKA